MQSLWSRVGQTRRCYCRSCSTVVTALGGRATAPTRRKPTFADIFTACYSSVFATAALVDAIRKDDRRQNLDRELEEARRDLAELRELNPDGSDGAASRPQDLSLQQMDGLWRTLKNIYNDRPFMKEIHKPATISGSDLIESLKREYYACPGEASLGAARQTDYEQLERAILAEESDIQASYRGPWKQSHLRMETTSIELLVRKFLDRSRFLPDEDSSPSPSLDAAYRTKDKGFPNYNYHAIDPVDSQNNTIILNQRLRSLMANPEMSMREKIGRTCYNLLISGYPPDMHTYNTLIVAFNRSGHHTFAEALVSSFFHSRLLQPTPSTFVAILNHYQCTNNHGKFLRALACLTGLEPIIGGKIRRRHVTDIELNPNLQRWAADMKRRTQTGEWVWEHIPLNQPLVEEIIRGLLHFKLFDQAAAFFISSMHSGVRLSVKTVKLVVDECANALDWRAAVRIIRALSNSPGKWQNMLLSDDAESNHYLATRIHVLIDICGLNSLAQPTRGLTLIDLRMSNFKYQKFLEALEMHVPVRAGSLALRDSFDEVKSRLLQCEGIGKEIDHVRNTTNSIESKLLYPDFSFSFRVSMALHIGASALRRSLQLSQEYESLVGGSGDSGGGEIERKEPLLGQKAVGDDLEAKCRLSRHTISETPLTEGFTPSWGLGSNVGTRTRRKSHETGLRPSPVW